MAVTLFLIPTLYVTATRRTARAQEALARWLRARGLVTGYSES
jgi:hypothetical protein